MSPMHLVSRAAAAQPARPGGGATSTLSPPPGVIEFSCRICEEPFRAPAKSPLAILKLCRDCFLVKAALRSQAEEERKKAH